MVVTDIIEVTKAKCSVYLDNEFAFVLYKGELRLYKIRKGEDISSETVDEIVNKVLPGRAKKRCMMLLQKKDYTEEELRRKLREGEYPSQAIDEALEYVKSFRYVDDERYCNSYITCYSSKWSKQQILSKLMGKGIPKETIQNCYENLIREGKLNCPEEELIREILRKKQYNPDTADYKQRQKLYQHLAYKGFSSEQIRRVLGEYT